MLSFYSFNFFQLHNEKPNTAKTTSIRPVVQVMNLAEAVSRRFGVVLNWWEVEEGNLLEAIHEVRAV